MVSGYGRMGKVMTRGEPISESLLLCQFAADRETAEAVPAPAVVNAWSVAVVSTSLAVLLEGTLGPSVRRHRQLL